MKLQLLKKFKAACKKAAKTWYVICSLIYLRGGGLFPSDPGLNSQNLNQSDPIIQNRDPKSVVECGLFDMLDLGAEFMSILNTLAIRVEELGLTNSTLNSTLVEKWNNLGYNIYKLNVKLYQFYSEETNGNLDDIKSELSKLKIEIAKVQIETIEIIDFIISNFLNQDFD